ncbi:hypothetical protein SV7mr_25240 [Stieleria bergensis]|uniref:DUF2235 domain-containing protein n=1 Tax=Stieleria bergensis TaxID=2528025 RepID=A0A517SV66_9BACT|nr:hypothetical protein SV7mr_25240 [Planctomycetes bacterium SV_7m_r]
MDNTVVTIYCCGTGEHRDKLDNIVPYTWRATNGARVYMNDGAGNGRYDILKSEHILKTVESGGNFWFQKDKAFKSKNTSLIKGNIGGVGTQDNIINSIQFLWMEYYAKNKPTFGTINLCGWSRGAVTCILLAHAIEEAGFRAMIPSLKVNIFAIDPVPGGVNDFGSGNFDKTGRVGTPDELAMCVNEYQAVLAENVGGAIGTAFRNCSPDFTGASRNSPMKTEFPLPGSHSNVAKINSGNTVGRLSISLCHRFLRRHGTDLLLPMEMSEDQELEQFAEILLQHGKFKKKGVFNRKKVFKKWSVATMRAGIVRNAERAHRFFVNHYHAELLERRLPRVAAYIAGGTPIGSSELQAVRLQFPKTYEVMSAIGYL